jgi:hypothetical protein
MEKSMRFVLTLVLVSGLISAAFAQPASKVPTEDERKAIDLVVKAGGTAEIDPTLPDSARVSAKFEAIADVGLLSLKKAPQIGSLDVFDATRCTDKGFAALKELAQLRRLTFGKSNMTSASTKAIGQCVEIRRLYLASSGLSDLELENLKPLTHLILLDISDNQQITDKGMATVKTFEWLQALYLGKTGITDKGLMELKGLDGLRSLNVVSTKVTADAAEKFADEMPNLRAVRR